jgi:hypothetical protein
MSDAHKTITPREMLAFGLIQEANRRFFHPLGLALMVTYDEADSDDSGAIAVLDSREDPEGFLFLNLDTDDAREKERRVTALAMSKALARLKKIEHDPSSILGTIVQKIGTSLME